MSNGFIYLIHLREFIKPWPRPIYKIGKTRQIDLKRPKSYPKGSVIEIHVRVDNCDRAETELIALFKLKFNFESDYGNEYFSGDRNKMVAEIVKYAKISEPLAEPVADERKDQLAKSVRPMEIDASEEISLLNKLYYPICYAATYLMSTYYDVSMKPIYDNYGLSRLHENGAHAELMANEQDIIIRLDKIASALKAAFGRPNKSKRVSCEQYQKYVHAHNILAKLDNDVAVYMDARDGMIEPSRFISVKLGKMAIIDKDTFDANRKKCFDASANGQRYAIYIE